MADVVQRPDALTRAAEKWGNARVSYRKKVGEQFTTRMVSTMRCLKCNQHVAWVRFKAHVLSHIRGTLSTA